MRRSKSRSSSLVFPSTSSADFSSQRCIVYTDKHVPMPLLITAPCCSCPRNLAGTAMRPLASIVCSYSPRNMSVGLQFAVPPACGPLRGCAQNVLPHSGVAHLFAPPTGQRRHFLWNPHHNPPLLPT